MIDVVHMYIGVNSKKSFKITLVVDLPFKHLRLTSRQALSLHDPERFFSLSQSRISLFNVQLALFI